MYMPCRPQKGKDGLIMG